MRSAEEIIQRLQRDFDVAPGLTVVGSGPLAIEVGELLGTGNPSTVLIVVVSDEPDDIRSAFQIADNLGTIVLICSDPPELVDVDVYADLHVRGLVVVGLA